MGLAVGAGAEFTVRSGPEHARRRQVPLGLGYALSIHRCQGMTLDRVELDLRSAFECGQVRARPVLRHLPSRAIFCPASSSVLRHLLACHLHSRRLFHPCISGGSLTSAVSASQVYVALSRCRSLQHIRVLGFDPAKVKAHPAALRFVEGLANTAPRGAEAVAG